MLVATSSLLVGEPLMFIDLLSDRVSDWEQKFSTEPKICAKRLSKIFRRVVRVIDVPLKLVA